MPARVDRDSPQPDPFAEPESSARYPGWRVVAVCFAMAVYAWGFGFYGHGLYLAELTHQRGWPASVVAGATTAYYLVSAILAAFVGDVLHRFGTRPVVIGGLACMGLAGALVPLVQAPWQLYADYMVMALGWASLSLAAITTILGDWFQSKRGLAISLALNGASFGGIIVVPAIAISAARFGFGPAVWSVAVVLAVVIAMLALLWLGPAPGRKDATTAGVRLHDATRREALRTVAFWSVSGPFALAFLAQVGFLVHEITLLEPMIGRAQAGVAVAVTTIMAVIGRLVMGAIIDRVDQRRATALSFASQALALVIVSQAHEAWLLIAACGLFGFSVGNVITLPALIIQREFAARDFAMLIGLSTAICQITYSFGPGLLGFLRDLSGSYVWPLMLCIGLEVMASATIMMRRGGAVA